MADAQGPVGGVTIRRARRNDVPALVELRVLYLAEMARFEPRYMLLPDVRERTEHALPVWIEQEERVLRVAERSTEDGTGGDLVGYATGVATIWPPVLRHPHVGEITEVFLVPGARRQGIGRDLVASVSEGLLARGASVLRAPVPVRSDEAIARFRAQGFEPLQHVLEKSLEEG